MVAVTEKICSIDSCNKPAKKRGWCGMHYVRWQRHGDPHKRLRKANGEGNISPSGYRRHQIDGVLKLDHDRIWEDAYGPIPEGFIVHHKNGDKLDNSLENLELMSRAEHAQYHAKLNAAAKGTTNTHKYCPRCDMVKLRSDFNRAKRSPDGLQGYCRVCSYENWKERYAW